MRVPHRAKQVSPKRNRRQNYLPEAMEQRTLLSVTLPAGWVAHPSDYRPASTPIVPLSTAGSATPTGVLSPQQIAGAYGLSGITFTGGITGDGTGQTIAIVAAYDDPNAAADLAAFDTALSLPAPPSFQKLNDTGLTGPLPTTDPAGKAAAAGNWSEEESMDVEWAHAIAPGASILLFEANDAGADLFNTVAHAANTTGVSVVICPWSGNETATEATSLDPVFTTPAAHQGVTFVTASGDYGGFAQGSTTYAPQYPATSPNVVTVGATNLTAPGNAYGAEGAWGSGDNSANLGGSGGGTSAFETQPNYQAFLASAFSISNRTYPDVSMVGDPNTGVSVYDSYDYGATPWAAAPAGGTSLSAVLFGGLIAIANQGRVANGLATLDGPSQTVPLIYNVPAGDFNDVTTGTSGYAAGAGYDLATGRGSPVGSALITDLTASSHIGSHVFNDLNQNGTQDAGDTGVASVVVNLHNAAGTLIASSTTDLSGFYDFPNVAAGNGYYLSIAPPAGYTVSTQVISANGNVNLANPVTSLTPAFNITANQDLLTENVGVYAQTITITPALVSVIRPESGLAPMVFTVTISPAPTVPVTVAYNTSDGTATVANGDYVAASGTITFPVGVTSETITVDAIGNTNIENDVSFSLNLVVPPNFIVAPGGTAVGSGLIQNNNFPVATIAAPAPQTRSATTVSTFPFTISLSAPAPFAVMVDYTTVDNSALAGTDYTAVNGTLTFPAGTTSEIVDVTALPGSNAQENKQFGVQLSQSTPITATIGTPSEAFGTILTNDPPVVSVNDGSVTESLSGTTYLPFTVDIAPALTGPVTVDYATSNGTAIAGVDYVAESGTLSFTTGRVENTVYVPVPQQFIQAQTRTLTLTIFNASNGLLISNATATGTINYVSLASIPFAAAVPASTTAPATRAVNAVYTDGLGQLVTVSMKGFGSGEVVFLGASSFYTNAFEIVLNNTTTADTSVNVRVARNGQTSITNFIANAAFGTLNGKTLNVVSSFAAAGTVNTINLGYLEGAAMSIGGTNTGATVALNFGRVANSTIASSIPIRSLTAVAYTNTTTGTLPITAPSVGTVRVRQNFDGTIETSTLQSLTVGGIIHGGARATASIGLVTALGAVNANFFAGIANGVTGLPTLVSQFTNQAANIGMIRIKSVFSASLIAAEELDSVRIGKVVTAPGSATFGISAGRVGMIRTVAGPAGQIVNLTSPSTGLTVDNFSILLVGVATPG